jgi:hypothetical protein
MPMKTLQEKIEVMQAALEGKTIQWRDLWLQGKLNDGNWSTGDHGLEGGGSIRDMEWNWSECDYRVKPEPATVEIERIRLEQFEALKCIQESTTALIGKLIGGGDTIKPDLEELARIANYLAEHT